MREKMKKITVASILFLMSLFTGFFVIEALSWFFTKKGIGSNKNSIRSYFKDTFQRNGKRFL